VRTALLALALTVAYPSAPLGGCFAISDPLYATLDPLVYKNGAQVVAAVKVRMDAIGKTGLPNPQQLAALYAVQADAYGILELDGEARKAAARGPRLVHGATDPLRLEMLSTQALNTYDQPGIKVAAGVITAARADQALGSRSELCLEAVLG
jgi:hypothetical protein